MKRFALSRVAEGIAILLLCLSTLFGCASTSSKTLPTFPIVHARELLLTAQAFPHSWQVDACTIGCDRTERPTHSLRTFGRRSIAGSVIQQVYVSEDAETAHAQFLHLQEAEFAELPPPNRTFVPSASLQYQSLVADESALGCGKDEVEACKVFLRYRNYVVEFYFDVKLGETEGLSVTDIPPILEDMDIQITRIFKIGLVTTLATS